MSSLDVLRDRWARKRFQRAAEKSCAAMVPFQDQIESENEMLSLLMVSGIAQLVATGQESQAALAHTIKQESIRSGISEDALAAHARFSSEMLTCFEFAQQNKSPR